MVNISIDAMGGDLGPQLAIEGAERARAQNKDINFIFYGKQEEILPILKQYKKLAQQSRFIHCDVAISMEQKPSQAIRAGRNFSSMWQAINAVKTGEASACVSAGNTGALMSMSYLILGMLPQIARPALAGIWPNLKGNSIVLDIGASIGAEAEHLVNLAIAGSSMFRSLYLKKNPTVGLLNIGAEEMKGMDQIKEAHLLLKNANLNGFDYKSFIEGNDIGTGAVDVVVTEGFTGNIALKTAEGTAKQIADIIKNSMLSSPLAKLGYLLSKGAFAKVKEKIDPTKSNGAVLIGLHGIVVKSHGHTTAEGYANAIKVAYEMVHNNLQEKIATGLHNFHSKKETSLRA